MVKLLHSYYGHRCYARALLQPWCERGCVCVMLLASVSGCPPQCADEIWHNFCAVCCVWHNGVCPFKNGHATQLFLWHAVCEVWLRVCFCYHEC